MKFKNVLLAIGLFCSIISYAQTIENIDSTTINVAVDITQISTETETTRLILSTLESTDFSKNKLSEMDSLVHIRGVQLKEDYQKFEAQDLSKISKASLDALISAWNINQHEVDNGINVVRELFEETTVNIDQIKKESEKWAATYQVLKASESPVELTENVKVLISNLQTAEEHLNENLSELVNIESDLGEISALVVNIDLQLTEAIAQRSRDIFVQNVPAIWNLKFTNNDTIISDSIILDSAAVATTNDYSLSHLRKEKIAISLDFIESQQNTIYFHLILWILTVVVSMRIGKKELKFDEDSDLSFAQTSMFEIRHNLFLTASYISILYAVFLYEFIPVLITEILVLILIFLNIKIQQKSGGKQITKIAILLAVAFITGQLNAESWLGDISYRFYIFAKIALTFWVLKLFIQYLQSNQESNSPTLWKKLNKLANLTYLLLVVGTFANILGFIKMADISILLVIQIIVVSFIFYGILVASNGLVSLIFRAVWIPKKSSSLDFRDSVEKMALKLVNILAALFWIKSVLATVGIYEPIKEAALGIFTATATIGSMSISLDEIIYALIVLVLTFSITRFIGILITEGGLDRFKLERGVPNAISLVVRYSMLGLGVMLALSVAGINLSSFSLMAGALGIGIGFGLQNIISNFVSGLILVFERPLQEGDVVEVNNLLGIVKNIGVRSSNIRTYTGAEVVVPNEALISKELINWTLSDPNKRLEIKVGVDYGSNPREIIKFLIEAASANPDVKKDPAPSAYFIEFGDSSLNFRLLFWVHNSIALSVHSDIMLRVSDVLRENDINIPFPIRTLMMDKESKEELISPELLKDPRKDVDLDVSGGINNDME